MKNKAFTLIELLVVVLIIGILAAIAVPKYQRAVSKTRAMQAIIALSKIREAQELYFLANNDYTSDLDELDISIEETYYRYSCSDGIRCFATPKKLSDPIPMFQFWALQKTANADYSALGRRWCHIRPGADANVQKRQIEICKMLGQPDPGMQGFYVIP